MARTFHVRSVPYSHHFLYPLLVLAAIVEETSCIVEGGRRIGKPLQHPGYLQSSSESHADLESCFGEFGKDTRARPQQVLRSSPSLLGDRSCLTGCFEDSRCVPSDIVSQLCRYKSLLALQSQSMDAGIFSDSTWRYLSHPPNCGTSPCFQPSLAMLPER